MQIRKEGIEYDSLAGDFKFDWKSDKGSDLVPLKLQSYNRYIATKQGVKLYYAYKFSKESDKQVKDLFRTAIKYLDSEKINSQDIDLMITKAFTSFNQLKPLQEYDVIVFPKSTSKLLEKIKSYLESKVATSLVVSDAFVKATFENITLDWDKINELPQEVKEKVLARIQKVTSKDSWKLRDVDVRHRYLIKNFLTFNSDLEKRVYNRVQGGTVLMIDDILTKGGTVANMSKLLVEAGAEEITGFIFLATN